MSHVRMDLIPKPVLNAFLRPSSKGKEVKPPSSAVRLEEMKEIKLVSTLMQFQREGVQ